MKCCKGACKYYISTLGVGGGSEGNAYLAYIAYVKDQNSYSPVKYHLTLWLKAIYGKISHIQWDQSSPGNSASHYPVLVDFCHTKLRFEEKKTICALPWENLRLLMRPKIPI